MRLTMSKNETPPQTDMITLLLNKLFRFSILKYSVILSSLGIPAYSVVVPYHVILTTPNQSVSDLHIIWEYIPDFSRDQATSVQATSLSKLSPNGFVVPATGFSHNNFDFPPTAANSVLTLDFIFFDPRGNIDDW